MNYVRPVPLKRFPKAMSEEFALFAGLPSEARNAILSGLASSIITASALLLSSSLQFRHTQTLQDERLAHSLLPFAASGGGRQIAYCNIIMWNNAGVFDGSKIDGNAILVSIEDQNPVISKSICNF